MPPVSHAPTDAPPGRDLRATLIDAMKDAGFSGRSLARELQSRKPRAGGAEKGAESWRNSLARYTTETESRRQLPDAETAALLAEVLVKPPGYFVRQQERKTARERALEEEVERLRQEIEEYRRRLGADARAGGGTP